MGKDEIAYLGSDTVYEGKLTFKGTVRIEGKYTGDIHSDGTLNVGKDAQVEGMLEVGELLLSGRFSGEITAKRRSWSILPACWKASCRRPICSQKKAASSRGKSS